MARLEVKRQMDSADIAAVTGLLEAAERADGHPALADHKWLDLVQGGRTGFAGLVAWEAEHPHPVAYAQVSRGNDSWGLEVVVHPHHRYEARSIAPDLLRAATEVVATEGGGHLHWWVFEPTATHAELAAGIGLRPGRLLYQMRRPLPAGQPTDVYSDYWLSFGLARMRRPLPAGQPTDRPADLATRAFVPGRDEAAWLDVNNRAFARHPEQGGWDLATLRAREHEAWFDPAGFLLHEREGRLAGFCWTKVHADREPVLGEIYVIAVDPDFHGLGLGRALTLAGLASLAERGVPVAMLYVDSENEAALSLYRSLGFEVDHCDRAFVGDIAAA